jgi:outer membrane protein assembly factor BamB
MSITSTRVLTTRPKPQTHHRTMGAASSASSSARSGARQSTSTPHLLADDRQNHTSPPEPPHPPPESDTAGVAEDADNAVDDTDVVCDAGDGDAGDGVSGDALRLLWRACVAPMQSERNGTGAPLSGATVVPGVGVVVGTSYDAQETGGGKLLCLDASDGSVRWELKQTPVYRRPVVSQNGSALFAATISGECNAVRVDAASGCEQWRTQLRGHGSRSPPCVDMDPHSGLEVVFVHAEPHFVFCLDAATGDIRWERESVRAVVGSCSQHAGMLTIPELDLLLVPAIVSLDAGFIIAFRMSNGDEAWRHPAAPLASGAPVLLGGDSEGGNVDVLLASSNANRQPRLMCLRITHGSACEDAWESPIPVLPSHGVEVVRDRAFLPWSDGTTAVKWGDDDATTRVRDCQVLWHSSASGTFRPVALEGGTMLALADGHTATVVAAEDGKLLWHDGSVSGTGARNQTSAQGAYDDAAGVLYLVAKGCVFAFQVRRDWGTKSAAKRVE